MSDDVFHNLPEAEQIPVPFRGKISAVRGVSYDGTSNKTTYTVCTEHPLRQLDLAAAGHELFLDASPCCVFSTRSPTRYRQQCDQRKPCASSKYCPLQLTGSPNVVIGHAAPLRRALPVHLLGKSSSLALLALRGCLQVEALNGKAQFKSCGRVLRRNDNRNCI